MKFKLFAVVVALAFAIVPAFAQETSDTHTLTYDGFGFAYDAAVGANVNIVSYAGDPTADAMPGFADAPYTQFLFYDAAPAAESLFDRGGVRVYRTADLTQYDFMAEQVAALQTLVNARVDLTGYMQTTPNANEFVLPFLPVVPAAQVIRARAAFVEGADVSGISYVTVYRQDASPFVSDEFWYTFQGLSADGAYYVSAVIRLTTDLFPAELPADFSMDEFIADLQTYFAESIATLNAAAPTAFTPSLETLDALFASFTFAE